MQVLGPFDHWREEFYFPSFSGFYMYINGSAERWCDIGLSNIVIEDFREEIRWYKLFDGCTNLGHTVEVAPL